MNLRLRFRQKTRLGKRVVGFDALVSKRLAKSCSKLRSKALLSALHLPEWKCAIGETHKA
jgi:hypothetical protein